MNKKDKKIANGIVPAIVLRNGKPCFIDIDGKESQTFESATVYAGGFALVKRANDKTYRFRDMLGNITSKKTEKGKDFFKFWCGEIGFEDLKVEYFADEKFYQFTKEIMTKQPLAQHFVAVCDAKRHDALSMDEMEIE